MPTGTYFMVLTMGGGTFVVKNYVVYNERINNDLQLPAFWGKYLSQAFGLSWSSPTYACVTWEPIYSNEPLPHRTIEWDESSDEDEEPDEFFDEDPIATLHAVDAERKIRRAIFNALMEEGVDAGRSAEYAARACPTEIQVISRRTASFHRVLSSSSEFQ